MADYADLFNTYLANRQDSGQTDYMPGGETEEEHQATLTLIREVKYDMAFMFAYSLREKTSAAYNLKDDIPEDIKGRRLQEVIVVLIDQWVNVKPTNEHLYQGNMTEEVIMKGSLEVEGEIHGSGNMGEQNDSADINNNNSNNTSNTCNKQSKSTPRWLSGRTDNNHRCLISPLLIWDNGINSARYPQPGDYVSMRITAIKGKTVYGIPISYSTISTYQPQ